MCVAVPGCVISIGEPSAGQVPAVVDFDDREVDINLVMVPDVQVGDWVIAHSGFAIRRTGKPSADIAGRGQTGER